MGPLAHPGRVAPSGSVRHQDDRDRGTGYRGSGDRDRGTGSRDTGYRGTGDRDRDRGNGLRDRTLDHAIRIYNAVYAVSDVDIVCRSRGDARR